MLLAESEKAKALRSAILDIVIATINEKTGGGTKYINRRDVNYIPAAITEENYRKNLTSAMSQCVAGHKTYKYSQVTDYIYEAVFKENAKEYRNVLSLDSKDNVRHTLYAEVLLVLTSSSCHPRKISHPIFLNENAIFEQPLVWEYESAILLSFFRVTQSVNQSVDYQTLTSLLQKSDEVRKENAKEYRNVLSLDSKDNVRHTLYAEVLLVISSFENGVGAAIQQRFKENGGRLLSMEEVKAIVNDSEI